MKDFINYNIEYKTIHHDGLKFYTFINPVNNIKSIISTKVARLYLSDIGIIEDDDKVAVLLFIEKIIKGKLNDKS